MARTGAGRLRQEYHFEKREVIENDGAGNELSDWVRQFTQRARRRFLRGGEGVQAARLEGRQPMIIKVRKNPRTATVTTAWRLIDTKSDVSYNIRAISEAENPQYFDVLAESGSANG